ncbi:MAG: guanylate kinase [Nitrospirota bacterium]|nr:guanylate kinase [Nitrospirota bacterium]
MTETRNGKGLLIVVSAPSGAGKTSLCQELTRTLPNLTHSISYTTRAPRNGEVNGKDYWFVSVETFEKMVAERAFAEWARVHQNLYGTALATLDDMRNKGKDVILDIDTQGAMQLREKMPDGAYIFILPPSMEILEERLRKRQSDREDEIQRRMAKAREEIAAYSSYDYIVVNEEFQTALAELKAIVTAEKCKVAYINNSWVDTTFLGG